MFNTMAFNYFRLVFEWKVFKREIFSLSLFFDHEIGINLYTVPDPSASRNSYGKIKENGRSFERFMRDTKLP